MNPWWLVMGLLGSTWALPMIGIRKAGFPWWFFVGFSCFWIAVCLVADPMYDWGVRLRRRMGMIRLADFAERMKPRVLPPARMALLLMALISLLAGLL